MRPYRAGQTIEDYCRSCHEDRIHTVVVVDEQQQPLRVTCDFCGSEHNFRGGGRTSTSGSPAGAGSPTPSGRDSRTAPTAATSGARPSMAAPLPLVSERELAEPT